MLNVRNPIVKCSVFLISFAQINNLSLLSDFSKSYYNELSEVLLLCEHGEIYKTNYKNASRRKSKIICKCVDKHKN